MKSKNFCVACLLGAATVCGVLGIFGAARTADDAYALSLLPPDTFGTRAPVATQNPDPLGTRPAGPTSPPGPIGPSGATGSTGPFEPTPTPTPTPPCPKLTSGSLVNVDPCAYPVATASVDLIPVPIQTGTPAFEVGLDTHDKTVREEAEQMFEDVRQEEGTNTDPGQQQYELGDAYLVPTLIPTLPFVPFP